MVLIDRFASKEKVIIYAWVNDETTLRIADSKTDAYRLFLEMLEAGEPRASRARCTVEAPWPTDSATL